MSDKHPVVFIKQGTTPTNVVRKFVLSTVAMVPQCLVVIYWLITSSVLVHVHWFQPAFT